jgi:hypothetical protein
LHPLPKLSGLGLERKMSPVCNSNWWQTDPSGATDNATVVAYLQNKGEHTPFLCIFYAEKFCCYATVSRQRWQWDISQAIRI